MASKVVTWDKTDLTAPGPAALPALTLGPANRTSQNTEVAAVALNWSARVVGMVHKGFYVHAAPCAPTLHATASAACSAGGPGCRPESLLNPSAPRHDATERVLFAPQSPWSTSAGALARHRGSGRRPDRAAASRLRTHLCAVWRPAAAQAGAAAPGRPTGRAGPLPTASINALRVVMLIRLCLVTLSCSRQTVWRVAKYVKPSGISGNKSVESMRGLRRLPAPGRARS